jgi:hypothetical protein
MVSVRFGAYLQVKRSLKSFDTFDLAICLGTLGIFLAEENVIRVEIIETLYLFDNATGLCFGLRHDRLLNCYLDEVRGWQEPIHQLDQYIYNLLFICFIKKIKYSFECRYLRVLSYCGF